MNDAPELFDQLVAQEEKASLVLRNACRIVANAEHQLRMAQLAMADYQRRKAVMERTRQGVEAEQRGVRV